MEDIFENAKRNRRAIEFTLTSRNTNAIYYGTPSMATKRDIWPPISSDIAFHDTIYLERETPEGDRRRLGEGDRNLSNVSTHENISFVPPDPEQLYEPLREGAVIRLLGLEAGKPGDHLRLHFYHADLAVSCPEYETLSYVWGENEYSAPRKDLAYVSGHQLPISVNLNDALRGLRSETRPRLIWVDAICINQGDVTERGHQVSLMSTIYGQAKYVIVWLGERHDERPLQVPQWLKGDDGGAGECIFTAICQVVNDWLGKDHSSRRATFEVVSSSGDRRVVQLSETVARKGLRSVNDHGFGASSIQLWSSQFWQAISYLFECTWFWRLWVFQEIVLARAATMKLGHAEIDWRWVGLAAAILRTKHHTICETMRIGGVYNAYLMFRISRQSDLEPIKLDFLRLLRLTRQFEVTDPRDRIYGLLGIATTDNHPGDEANLLVRPDYEISTYELWLKIAAQLLTKNENLSVLSCVQYSTDELESEARSLSTFSLWSKNTSDGPVPASWVPQWDQVYRATLSSWDYMETFSASRGLPRTCIEPISSHKLFLQGIRTGTIVYCSRYMWQGADFSLLQSEELKKFFSSAGGLRLLARTMMAGRDSYGSIRPDNPEAVADVAAFVCSWNGNSDRSMFARFDQDRVEPYRPIFDPNRLPRMPNSGKVDISNVIPKHIWKLAEGGVAERFADTARRFCERRRLFITMNGHLGLGPDTVQEGDVLCVLNGGDMPFVLRPRDTRDHPDNRRSSRQHAAEEKNRNIGDGRHYLLVGECYVEGMMTGEAVAQLGKPFPGLIPSDLIYKTILEAYSPSQVHSINMMRTARSHYAELEEYIGDDWEVLVEAIHEPLRKSWFSIL